MAAKKLSAEGAEKIKDVIHTLNYGLVTGWVLPEASLYACMEILDKVRRSMLVPVVPSPDAEDCPEQAIEIVKDHFRKKYEQHPAMISQLREGQGFEEWWRSVPYREVDQSGMIQAERSAKEAWHARDAEVAELRRQAEAAIASSQQWKQCALDAESRIQDGGE